MLLGDFMELKWHGLFDFNAITVKKCVADKGGNYMISVGLREGGYRSIYIGKAKFLETRLLQHLSIDEDNDCIKSRVNSKALYFRYCYVDSEIGRQNVEHTLYKKYTPTCNQKEPEGREITITFPY